MSMCLDAHGGTSQMGDVYRPCRPQHEVGHDQCAIHVAIVQSEFRILKGSDSKIDHDVMTCPIPDSYQQSIGRDRGMHGESDLHCRWDSDHPFDNRM